MTGITLLCYGFYNFFANRSVDGNGFTLIDAQNVRSDNLSHRLKVRNHVIILTIGFTGRSVLYQIAYSVITHSHYSSSLILILMTMNAKAS